MILLLISPIPSLVKRGGISPLEKTCLPSGRRG
jgi:hypothetical protein